MKKFAYLVPSFCFGFGFGFVYATSLRSTGEKCGKYLLKK